MDKAAQGAALEMMAAVPVVGGALSGLLGGLIESLKEQKQLEDQCDSLRERLPELFEELQQLTTDDEVYETLIKGVREEVEVFNQFVQEQEKRVRWSASQSGNAGAKRGGI